MRKSLKTQIAVLFIGLIGFVFLANWCTNNFLLERYYVAKKEAALQHIYDAMNKVEDEDDYLTDEFADVVKIINLGSSLKKLYKPAIYRALLP